MVYSESPDKILVCKPYSFSSFLHTTTRSTITTQTCLCYCLVYNPFLTQHCLNYPKALHELALPLGSVLSRCPSCRQMTHVRTSGQAYEFSSQCLDTIHTHHGPGDLQLIPLAPASLLRKHSYSPHFPKGEVLSSPFCKATPLFTSRVLSTFC